MIVFGRQVRITMQKLSRQLYGLSSPANGVSDDVAFQCLHVDAMAADYGGTDIHGALKMAFESRQHEHPTACFLLTDGEVRNKCS